MKRMFCLAVLLMTSSAGWALEASEHEAARLVQRYFRQVFFELYRVKGGRIAEHWDARSETESGSR